MIARRPIVAVAVYWQHANFKALAWPDDRRREHLEALRMRAHHYAYGRVGGGTAIRPVAISINAHREDRYLRVALRLHQVAVRRGPKMMRTVSLGFELALLHHHVYQVHVPPPGCG